MNRLNHDLNHILEHTQTLWDELQHARLFITGGTGFFGHWLLESFIYANTTFNLNAECVVLTRNKEAFLKKSPHFKNVNCLTFIEGDVKQFAFPEGRFTHVIHAATDASAHINETNPLLMLDTIVEGTRRTLEFAKHTGAQKFLLTSSGAVYGRQPSDLTHVNEDYTGKPNLYDHRAAYSVGKCTAEHLAFLYGHQFGLDVKIARCFAFVGPYLPLDIHFAIGNFIRDALKGGPVTVGGDGTPYRSYLYAADLAIWLWTILLKGKTLVPYNVGSEEAYSIKEIAHLVAKAIDPAIAVNVLRTPDPAQKPDRYVPDTKRAQTDLKLKQRISLEKAILATAQWHSHSELSHSC